MLGSSVWQHGHLSFYAHVLSLLGPTSYQECEEEEYSSSGCTAFLQKPESYVVSPLPGLVMNARHHFSHQGHFLRYSIHHIPWPE